MTRGSPRCNSRSSSTRSSRSRSSRLVAFVKNVFTLNEFYSNRVEAVVPKSGYVCQKFVAKPVSEGSRVNEG